MKVAILASSNFDYIADVLIVQAVSKKILLEVYLPGYSQINQELFNRKSGLYEFDPDIVFLFTRSQDFSDYFKEIEIGGDDSDIDKHIDEYISHCRSWVEVLEKESFTAFIATEPRPLNYIRPVSTVGGLNRVVSTWHDINKQLYQITSKSLTVALLDIDSLVYEKGMDNWYDPDLWYLAKVSGGTMISKELSDLMMIPIMEVAGYRKKCLVLDLDGTLWKGVVGDDGVKGIVMDGEYPGNIFSDIQKILLEMKKRGVLLSVVSKNTESIVHDAIKNHPDMKLSMEDFVFPKINWDPKSKNIADIAQDLNISTDAMVFLDDNPIECEEVKTNLPGVTVFQVPKNLSMYPGIFRDIYRLFDGYRASREDDKRYVLVKNDEKRSIERRKHSDFNDYLTSLGMKATIYRINDLNFSRVTQLIGKTNQFNLTTKRYTEGEIKEIMSSGDYLTYAVGLKDKYGDMGITLIAIVKIETQATMELFLMSCRVMIRGFEFAAMEFILLELKRKGVKELHSKYIPTYKNKPVRYFYDDSNFKVVSSDVDSKGVIHYCYNIGEGVINMNNNIEVKVDYGN